MAIEEDFKDGQHVEQDLQYSAPEMDRFRVAPVGDTFAVDGFCTVCREEVYYQLLDLEALIFDFLEASAIDEDLKVELREACLQESYNLTAVDAASNRLFYKNRFLQRLNPKEFDLFHFLNTFSILIKLLNADKNPKNISEIILSDQTKYILSDLKVARESPARKLPSHIVERLKGVMDVLKRWYTGACNKVRYFDYFAELDWELLEVFEPEADINLQITTRKFGFNSPENVEGAEVIDTQKPTVVILAFGEDSLTLAQELDKLNECNIVLRTDKTKFFVTRDRGIALVSDYVVVKDGRLCLVKDNFVVCADYFFGVIEDGLGAMIELPGGNIKGIEEYTEDKGVALGILEKKGVAVPNYLSLRGQNTMTRSEIKNFISSSDSEEVVIKPIDGKCGQNVDFFRKENVEEAISFGRHLLSGGNGINLEERIDSLPIYIENTRKDWNLRVFVARNDNEGMVVSGMVARIDDWGKPVNFSITAKPESYAEIARLLNLSEEEQRELRGQIENTALAAASAIESEYRANKDVPEGNQQDFMGVDIIVTQEGNRRVPKVIEVNDCRSGGMWKASQVSQKGENVCTDLAKVMIQRAKLQKEKMAA